MKDMGEASVIRGLKLTQATEEITLSQSHYIVKSIHEKYSYLDCRFSCTTYDPKVTLMKNESSVPIYVSVMIFLNY